MFAAAHRYKASADASGTAFAETGLA